MCSASFSGVAYAISWRWKFAEMNKPAVFEKMAEAIGYDIQFTFKRPYEKIDEQALSWLNSGLHVYLYVYLQTF